MKEEIKISNEDIEENKEDILEEKKEDDDKWKFDDYAFTITGIFVGVILVGPQLLYSLFGIEILGGDLSDVGEVFEYLDDGYGLGVWNINTLRALSPLLFLLTTTICFFRDAFVARKTGGYSGSLFTHTFESLVEGAIYMAITTIMVFGGVLFGAMYASWLAGPVTWILFVFIFPIVKKKSTNTDEVKVPWFLLSVFSVGIIAEFATGAWIAFPFAWLLICGIKFIDTVRAGIKLVDDVFEIIYLGFSAILIAVGLLFDFWLVSWIAFPVALFICWILSKFKRFKRIQE